MWTATGEYITYTNWLHDEPNNYGGNEHYIHLNWGHGTPYELLVNVTGQWNDISLDGKVDSLYYPMYAICESNQNG